MKPDQPPPDPVLLDEPLTLKISSREPIKLRRGEEDIHVRLRWDGKDRLLTGKQPAWRVSARLVDGAGGLQPGFNFSEPTAGRFTLLISSRPEWKVGDRLKFEVTANGPRHRALVTSFVGVVVDPPEPAPEDAPRIVESEFKAGTNRRPPYDLKYISRDDYDDIPCWNETSWTDQDPGCFKEPTSRTPLTLIINEDMEALREYKRILTKKHTEQEVERRVNKYTSHIAYHLYQMYQASQGRKEDDLDAAETRRREEIGRVAMTLIKLMEVAR